jgi:thiamine-phosphate pyrophosphorylase
MRIAIAAQCDYIQIREKDLSARELLRLAQDAVTAAAPTTHILVNDRLDVAVAAGAAGVHLGGSSMPLGATKQYAQKHSPPDFLVGVSCHNLEEARGAENSGASYIFFGPIFDTPAKRSFGAPQGLDRLHEVSDSLKMAVIAIGGVNEMNAAECIGAGASGIAGIRMFQEAANEKSLAETIARIHALKKK